MHRYVSLPVLVALVVACIFTACSSSGTLDSGKPASLESVMQRLNERDTRISSFFGEGKVSVETKEEGHSGNITIKILKPDSLMIEVTGPFGVSVAKGLVTKERFTLYNSLENSVAQGTTSAKNLKMVLRFPIEFNEVMEILAGSISFPTRTDAGAPTGFQQGDDYIILYKNAAGMAEYTIDRSLNAVKRIIRRDNDSAIVEDVMFKDFRRRSGMQFPHVISITRPRSEEGLTLMYNSVLINEQDLDFTLKIPKSATKLHF